MWESNLKRAAIVALSAALVAGCGSATSGGSSTGSTATGGSSASALAPVHGSYSPAIDPANFVSRIDNPYFPLRPGTAFHYVGVAEDGTTRQIDNEVVTHGTKTIMGVPATVIRDTVSQHGHPVERTFDWYAQDRAGNVWYMGEGTSELHHGHFSRATDSWTGGVNGAQPGIIMPGRPSRGQEYRQEYYPGHAMDQARVLGSGGAVTVPYGSFKKTLMTDETSPSIDPGVHEHKLYVKGVGDVKEQTVAGNKEEIRLVSVRHRTG
jgi:hypothetical protein